MISKTLYLYYIKRILKISCYLQTIFTLFFVFIQAPIIFNFLNSIKLNFLEILQLILLQVLIFYRYILFFTLLLSLLIVFYHDFMKNNMEVMLIQCGVDRKVLLFLVYGICIFFISITLIVRYFSPNENDLLHKIYSLVKDNLLSSVKSNNLYDIYGFQLYCIQERFSNNLRGIFIKLFDNCLYIDSVLYTNCKYYINNIFIHNQAYDIEINCESIEFFSSIERDNAISKNMIYSVIKAISKNSLYIAYMTMPLWLYSCIFDKIWHVKYIVSFLFFLILLQVVKVMRFNLSLFFLLIFFVYMFFSRQENV